MSYVIDGVYFEINQEKDISFCIVEEFSTSLEELIRKKLVSICKGHYNAENKAQIHTYKNSLKGFVKRFKGKTEDQKKGLIGEFLVHLLFVEVFDTFKPASPFFNREEKSFTKGIDVILIDSSTDEMWVVEVKSGVVNVDQTSGLKNLDNLQTGKSSLITKTLTSSNDDVWDNALNKITINDKKLRKKLEEVIETNFSLADSGTYSTNNENIILSSVVFNKIQDRIQLTDVQNYKKTVDKKDESNKTKFKSTMFFSIQKETYEKVFHFIETESLNV